jgi:hypothetical protein
LVIAGLQPVLAIQFGLEAALPMQAWRTKALHKVRVWQLRNNERKHENINRAPVPERTELNRSFN